MINTYPMVYLISMFASVLATPLVVRLARRFNVLDQPDARKVHHVAVPRIGGVAIIVAMMIGLLPAFLFNDKLQAEFDRNSVQFYTMLIAACAIFTVGLLDDLLNLPSKIKLVALVLASLAVCRAGVLIEHLPFVDDFSVPWVSWLITIFWIVLVTVAINFIDGLDGLAAGISAIA